jgi:NADH-quinone oxidoreductase subunit N
MFLKEPNKDMNTVYYNISKPLMVIIGIAVIVTVTSVFFFQQLLSYITYMIDYSVL